MKKQADLIEYLFAGEPHPLSGWLFKWMETSPRFTAFVETYRDKIRKKIRTNPKPESILDLRSELEVAFGLLSDRRLDIAYEPYASQKKRGPDFAVTYRANLIFNLEVARIRAQDWGADGIDLLRKEERLLRILLDKLGQMQTGMANLLAIHTGAELARSFDLGRFMGEVKRKADGRDASFYAAARQSSPAGFYKDFQQLSAILFWCTPAQRWVNKQARFRLDERILRLVSSLASCAEMVGDEQES